jgi:glycosyltransferase involved in cell wall biosynthesis
VRVGAMQHVLKHLADIDVLLILEFYSTALLHECQRRGIPTILKVNYEFLPKGRRYHPNVYMCSTSLNYEAVDEENRVLIPDPIDTEVFKFQPRQRAVTFTHVAGTFGLHNANCTPVVLEAIQLVKNPDVRFIVCSQRRLPSPLPSNVEMRYTVSNPQQLYDGGDVLLQPQKFRATSLPIQEAHAVGIPVITTDYAPFSEFCDFLVPATKSFCRLTGLQRPVFVHEVTPQAVAAKINEVAGQDISTLSVKARKWAQTQSWAVVKPRLLQLVEQTYHNSSGKCSSL